MLFDSQTADRITGLLLLLLGISMLAGGYTMDRLEIRQIHPSSIPGLVPMALGLAMMVCAMLLLLSSGNAKTKTPELKTTEQNKTPSHTGSFKHFFVTLILSLAYAAGLVGNVHFSLATGIYLFVFTLYFTCPLPKSGMSVWVKTLALNVIFAAFFATAISALFRYAFLVRLP